ncbi:hypothetical protein BDV19DRAFT_385382 [Aspergillus venezuelensis]
MAKVRVTATYSQTRREKIVKACESLQDYYTAITEGFRNAARQGHNKIAQQIFDIASNPTFGESYDHGISKRVPKTREAILIKMLKAKLSVGRHKTTGFVPNFKRHIGVIDRWVGLVQDDTDHGPLIRDMLQKLEEELKEKAMRLLTAKLPEVGEEMEDTDSVLYPLTLEAMAGIIRISIETSSTHGFGGLLYMFLELASLPPDCVTDCVKNAAVEALRGATHDEYTRSLDRGKTMELLDRDLPAAVCPVLIRLLRKSNVDTTEPLISIRTGGKMFECHRDVLHYWSGLFQMWLRESRVDGDILDCGDNIQADIMCKVIDFMYTRDL